MEATTIQNDSKLEINQTKVYIRFPTSLVYFIVCITVPSLTWCVYLVKTIKYFNPRIKKGVLYVSRVCVSVVASHLLGFA